MTRWIFALALGAALTACGAGAAARDTTTAAASDLTTCPAGQVRVSYDGRTRCLALEARVRIRLTFERTRSLDQTARLHRLTIAAARRIVADPRSRIVPAGGGARDLGSEVRCSRVDPRIALAELTWTPAAKPGTQTVAMSLYADGLERGAFWSGRPLEPERQTLTWTRLRGQAIHFWYVLTLGDAGWTPSAPARLTGPLCAVPQRP